MESTCVRVCVEILTSDINDQECLNTNTVKRTLNYVLYI